MKTIKLYFDSAEMWKHHLEKERDKCFFKKHVTRVYAGIKNGKYWYQFSYK